MGAAVLFAFALGVRNKAQMDTIKAEKENEKKASAPNKEDMLRKLAELTTGIALDTSVDVEELETEEEFEEEEARDETAPIKNGGPFIGSRKSYESQETTRQKVEYP